MRNLARLICVFAALTAAAPMPAQAQTTTAFDGTYVGVSQSFVGGPRRGCKGDAAAPAPRPLTILNGMARVPWAQGPLQGQVDAQGMIVMRNDYGERMQVQIDTRGTARGRNSGTACVYDEVWQKQ